MATIARLKTWIAGDVLTASDLNAEFNNIVNDYNGNINHTNLSNLTILPYGATLSFQNGGSTTIQVASNGSLTFMS